MMKKIYAFIVAIIALSACNRDLETEGLSRITYYPTFELEGGNLVIFQVGDTYSEPGISVTEQGAPIEFETAGTVDTSTPGFYPITYSAVNKDGYAGIAVRTVVVMEANVPDLDIEGTWTSNTPSFAGASLGQTLTVTKIRDGIYSASDSYAHPNIDIPVRFLINADGTATLEPIPNSAFGLPLYGKVTFNVTTGGVVHFPGGLAGAAPRDADMAFGIFLDDPAAPFYTIKTWLKD